MAEIHYISIDEARDIHLATIRNSGGGDCGELDIGKLESVLCHIQNDDYYPTFLDNSYYFNSNVSTKKRLYGSC